MANNLNQANLEVSGDFLGFVQQEFYQTSSWMTQFSQNLGHTLGVSPSIVRDVFLVTSIALAVFIVWCVYRFRHHSRNHREMQLRRLFGLDHFWPEI